MEYEESSQFPVPSYQSRGPKFPVTSSRKAIAERGQLATGNWSLETQLVWSVVSPPDAIWKAPYSARFHGGASVPGG
jgi:hypothetical protein